MPHPNVVTTLWMVPVHPLESASSASQPREPRGHATTTLHASHGYEIVREYPLPDVTTKEDLNQLIGQKILYAWDDDTAYGWYIRSICNTNLGKRDMRTVPRANCVVKYDKNDTKLAGLHGQVACELSKTLYGPDQWWVLLKAKYTPCRLNKS